MKRIKVLFLILAICLVVICVIWGFDRESIERMAIDHAGNIYLKVNIKESFNKEESVLETVDPSGKLIWTKKVDGTLLENLYESGLFIEYITANDLMVEKFDKQGHRIVLTRLRLPAGMEYGEIIKVLPDGYLYFTLDRNYSNGTSSLQNPVKPHGRVTYKLLKYNLQGDLVQTCVVGHVSWVEHEFSEICQVADHLGNLFVVGENYGNPTRNISFYKFNHGEVEYHEALISSNQSWLVNDMVVDNQDQVYLTGLTSYLGETNQVLCNVLVGKYQNKTGKLEVKQFPNPEPSEGKVVRVSNRNIFILGDKMEVRNGTQTGRVTTYILKLSKSVKKLWLTNVGTNWQGKNMVMNVDRYENVYTGEDSFVSHLIKKYSPSGKLVWSKRIWSVKRLVIKSMGLLGLIMILLQIIWQRKITSNSVMGK